MSLYIPQMQQRDSRAYYQNTAKSFLDGVRMSRDYEWQQAQQDNMLEAQARAREASARADKQVYDYEKRKLGQTDRSLGQTDESLRQSQEKINEHKLHQAHQRGVIDANLEMAKDKHADVLSEMAYRDKKREGDALVYADREEKNLAKKKALDWEADIKKRAAATENTWFSPTPVTLSDGTVEYVKGDWNFLKDEKDYFHEFAAEQPLEQYRPKDLTPRLPEHKGARVYPNVLPDAVGREGKPVMSINEVLARAKEGQLRSSYDVEYLNQAQIQNNLPSNLLEYTGGY